MEVSNVFKSVSADWCLITKTLVATEWWRQKYRLSVCMSSEQLHTTNLAFPVGLWAIRKSLSLSHLRWLHGTWRNRKSNDTRNERMDTGDGGRRDRKRCVPGSLAAVRRSPLKSKAESQQSSQTLIRLTCHPSLQLTSLVLNVSFFGV